jgi:CHAT domain-containing protein
MAHPHRRWLIVGMLVALGAAVCADAASDASELKSAHLTYSNTRTSGLPTQSATITVARKNLERAVALRKLLTAHDLDAAIRLFASSARQFLEVGAQREAAQAELEVADTYQMMSAYQRAIAAYHRSLALAASDAKPRCAALSHLARTYANIGRVAEAVQYSDQAVGACQTVPDNRALADALEAQGEAKFWSSQMTDAVSLFTRARQIAHDANDPDGEALSAMMLAQAVNAGDRKQSSRLAWDALNLWTGIENPYGAARAHMVLAFFAGGAGNFALAQCHCERALPVFQRIGDKDNEAIARNVLGMVARQSGDLEASLNHYQLARRDFIAAQDDLGEAESITGMAAVLTSQRNYASLLSLYTRKLQLAQKTGNGALSASSWIDIARVYQIQHKYAESEANYQRGLAEYRTAGNRYGEGTALMRIAELRAEEGEPADSLDLYSQAGKLKEQNGEIEDLARIQYSIARVYRRLNRLEEARSEIEKTIDLIESQRLRITKFDTRAQYFASVHAYYSLYIQVLMDLYHLHPDRNYNELALEAAEKSKVRALLDLLQNTSSASCDELLAQDAKAGSAQQAETAATSPSSAASTQPLTLAQMQAEIGDNDNVLLEYALGDDRSYAWLVDGNGISQFELPPGAEIRNRARAFREALAPIVAHEHEAPLAYLQRRRRAKNLQSIKAKDLAEVLLGPLNLPPGKRLLIVPDGPLQYVPFGALPVTGTKGVTALIESHELAMLPSASVLAVLRKTAARRPPPTNGVAVFADPVFEKRGMTSSSANRNVAVALPRSRDLNRALQDASGWQHIPSLPGSHTEALAIRQIVGPEHTRLAVGFDANRRSVIDGWIADYRIVHFATHGIVDTRHPEMSGLILSLFNARGEPQDGYLRLSDIYNLKLSADLVVLSSCESALGRNLESEGTIGLPRGFLYAGARSVIASLWKVDDDATAILMKDLYRRIQLGESPSKALRDAQFTLSKDQRFSDPYYWAGFVLEGDFN